MNVSILILLEVPLQPKAHDFSHWDEGCFNPYFTGSTTSTRAVFPIHDAHENISFNPYFTGSTTSTSGLIRYTID